MFEWIGKLWFALRCRIGRTYVTAYSGAKTKRYGYVMVFGESIPMIMHVKDGMVDYTHDEIAERAIPCILCGKPIVWCDPIGLVLVREDHALPKGAHFYEPAGAYVACQRWDCNNLFARGHWMPRDDDPMLFNVRRIESPDEFLTGNTYLEWASGKDGPKALIEIIQDPAQSPPSH